MNLQRLFEMQRQLDAHIEKEHPRELGEDRLAKKILALQVEKTSAKLFTMNDMNSTVRQRAMMRARLASDCEEKDRWMERLQLVEQWKDEIKRVR